MMETLWMFLPAGLVGIAIAWYLLRKSHARGEKRVLKEQVQAWEDEGGNVPDVPTVRPRRGSSRRGP